MYRWTNGAESLSAAAGVWAECECVGTARTSCACAHENVYRGRAQMACVERVKRARFCVCACVCVRAGRAACSASCEQQCAARNARA
eukprot:4960623-Alexandrium_andersonii.AAC.1